MLVPSKQFNCMRQKIAILLCTTSYHPALTPQLPCIPGGCEDLLGVSADGVDRAVVTFDLPNGGEVVHIPDLHHAPPAGAEEHRPTRDVGQGTYPVLVGVGDLLEDTEECRGQFS